MPVKWTNKSRPPSSGVMKPKPLSSENHLTVPVPTDTPRLLPRRGPEPRAALNDDRLLPALTWRTYPGYDSACKRYLTRELLRHRGDLVTVPRRRHPREPQGVGVV